MYLKQLKEVTRAARPSLKKSKHGESAQIPRSTSSVVDLLDDFDNTRDIGNSTGKERGSSQLLPQEQSKERSNEPRERSSDGSLCLGQRDSNVGSLESSTIVGSISTEADLKKKSMSF